MCSLKDVTIFNLIEKERNEDVSDVVGPVEEQLIEVLLEELLDDSTALVYWQEMEGLIEQMEGPWG